MNKKKAGGIESFHPPRLYPDYKSTVLRAPHRPLILVPGIFDDAYGPVFGESEVGPDDHDLTKNGRRDGEPLGERMIVHGKVMDLNGKGIPNTLVELWQANSAGRYIHKVDQHDAPLDPNFLGAGRCLTDQEGCYLFYTIKPGAYPWGNHYNAWRPQHLHFSVFGRNISSRLVTQMYFPGDPLLLYDPIYESAPETTRHLMVADFDLDRTEPMFALGYKFDIVLNGRNESRFENR